MNKQVIVVEGIHDQEKVNKAFPHTTVLTTNGSAIKDYLIEQLKTLSLNNEIILLLDPDYPGNKIRTTLNQHIPNALNVYIKKEDCTNKEGKVGIEYATVEVIKSALKNIRYKTNNSNITMPFLIDNNYIGAANSKQKRYNLLKKLNLGQANGKTFFKLLKAYGITKEEVLAYET